MTESAAGWLRQVPLFAGLDEEALRVLERCSRRRRFPADEALFHEGDPGHVLYVILSGRVHIRRSLPSGEIIHIASRQAGEFFGEMALIDGSDRMADAVTATACELLMVDGEAFVRCLDGAPGLARKVASCIAERLRDAARRLEAEHTQDVLGRVSGAVLELAARHGVVATPSGERIEVRISQQELALHAGTTRESANRALRRLRQVNAVHYEGRRLVLVDRSRLEAYAGGGLQ